MDSCRRRLLAGYFCEPLVVTPDAAPSSAGQFPLKRLLLVMGLVATLYAAALLVWGNSPQTPMAVLWSWTGLQATALCVLNYVLRGMRWRLWMANYGRHFGWLEGLRFYLAGYAFTPTPGNLGEAVRGLMLARKPLSTTQSLAIFGAERLADLLCLLLLCLPALGWLLARTPLREAMQAWSGVVTVLLGAAVICMAIGLWLLLRLRRRGLQRFVWLTEAAQCLALRPWLWFCLTLAAWAAQGMALWLLCGAMNVQLPLLTAISFYAVAMVAGALSALPAGLGGMEAVLTGLLLAQSAGMAAAVGITVLARLLTLWLAVAIGASALFYSAAIRKDIRF